MVTAANTNLSKSTQVLSKNAFRLLVIVFWIKYTILDFVEVIIRKLPIIGSFSQLLIGFFIAALIVLSIPFMLKNIRATDLLFYVICAALVLGTLVLNYNASSYIKDDLWRILGLSVPVFFIGITYDYELSKDDLFLVSFAAVTIMFIYQFYQIFQGRELSNDNMNTAYNVLPSVMYLTYWAIQKKNAKYWLLCILSNITIFVYGTRGPMLAAMIFLIFGIIANMFFNKKTLKTIALFAIILFVIYLLFFKGLVINIANVMSELFENIGFSTRIFDKFLSGNISDSSGRDVLYQAVIDGIREKPLLGYGLMGDRTLNDGAYVHNVILELFAQFGVIIGSAVIIAVICIVLKALFKTRRDGVFGFVLMLVCMVFTKLMLSGSYITEPYFFFMIGVAINCIRNKKYKTQTEK